MKDNDDLLIASFFEQYGQNTIADNGFSERVMSRLPRREVSEKERLNRLWTVLCAVAAAALFLCSGGVSTLLDIARNAWYNLMGVMFSAEMSLISVLTGFLAFLVVLSVLVYNIAAEDEKSSFMSAGVSSRHPV